MSNRGFAPLLPDACVGCSACVTACPVAAADGTFAGPKVLGPALSRRLPGGWPGEPGLTPEDAEALGASRCLQCHQCDLACPSGLSVSDQVRRAKELAGALPRGAWDRFTGRLLADQERFGRLIAATAGARRLARWLGAGLGHRAESAALKALGLSASRSVPAPVRWNLAGWVAATRDPVAERRRPPVLLYAGCHARFYDPAVGRAAVSVLRRAGYRVIVPAQVCCGAPARSQGVEDLAARAAAANVRLLSHASERLGGDVPIVSPCPSCTLALRRAIPELAPGRTAESLAESTWDLGEFLTSPARPAVAAAARRLPAELARERWVYHAPCHLRALGVGRPFPELLQTLGLGQPLDPGPRGDGCCGMGGPTGLTRDGHPRSLADGAPVLEVYRSLAAEPTGETSEHGRRPVALSDCPACRWQIADASGLPTAHPVEFLAKALERAD